MTTKKAYSQRKSCAICRKRPCETRHSKSYNHAMRDFVELCHPCHSALHLCNQSNFFDWNYLMSNKKDMILEEAEKIVKRIAVSKGKRRIMK